MKQIVILGAGFGGLSAAKLLAKKLKNAGLNDKYKITLVDRNDYHTYTPMLYEAATTAKETANYIELRNIATFPMSVALKNSGINFIKNEIVKINIADGVVQLRNETLTCDYLVLALGSETNFFGIPGLEERALTLKTFIDALRLRDTILNAIAENQNARIIIGGGGSTGVELAGEIKMWMPQTRVSIIEASESVLFGFAPKVVRKAEKRLMCLGIEIITSERITSIDEKKVKLASGKDVAYNVFVWGGGTKASKLISELPLKIEEGKRGRVEVAEEMECLVRTPDLTLRSKIYATGDNVCSKAPSVARAAIDHAKIASSNIIADILNEEGRGKFGHKIYKSYDYPYIIPVGGKYAIVKIGPFVISGFFGWIIKGIVELNYLLSILPFWRALKVWLKGIKIFIQNDRLG
ncbi:hypothetical protein A3A20_00710 [Candidatus Wolfebacteria bacterium RIFCSPLOWO2_01_FULL_45_19]|uniref:FAD/NAD(P)-binding domain-containing protein n=1 Tax=Candidatus Wolfebacteria bacterium RIFCSPLOWO2_01_FULL_45_19 TaxID=1802557 RepID=A0A1F8DPS7_9BACT|nr:MAG: FAD-dependent pyridine nucleotide-disulfide oxidoreductase [Parcubacteria group bacterium GW2011_GWB1_45_9]OGM90624.1 MAG: hypothetical protein A3A20_00710 [Candidatus Wolfebacteria bacterium RIFCSPLOWO2_01_FULL_45_19]